MLRHLVEAIEQEPRVRRQEGGRSQLAGPGDGSNDRSQAAAMMTAWSYSVARTC